MTHNEHVCSSSNLQYLITKHYNNLNKLEINIQSLTKSRTFCEISSNMHISSPYE